MFKTDKEKALVALQGRVQRLREKPTVPINAPKGESQSNGAIENAVQRFEGNFRAMRLKLEADIGERIPLHHPIIHWMVEAAAELHNRFREVTPDGKVPYDLIKGTRQLRPMVDFGECIYFMPAKSSDPKHKAEAKFLEGVWLGVNPKTDEAIVFGPNGVELVRTVKRKTVDEAFDRDTVLGVNVKPWEKKAMDLLSPEDPKEAPVMKEYQKDENVPGMKPYTWPIRKEDLENAGCTDGCPGCKAAVLGKHGMHSAECRKRIAEFLEGIDEGKDRMSRAEARAAEARSEKQNDHSRPYSKRSRRRTAEQ